MKCTYMKCTHEVHCMRVCVARKSQRKRNNKNRAFREGKMYMAQLDAVEKSFMSGVGLWKNVCSCSLIFFLMKKGILCMRREGLT